MADTVKKSRIVSDPECLASYEEDTSLQDIINEEFNQRLKSCMQEEPYPEPNAEHIALTYEPAEVVLKNGDHKPQIQDLSLDLKNKTSKDLTEPSVLSDEQLKELSTKENGNHATKPEEEESSHPKEDLTSPNSQNGLNIHSSDHSTEDQIEISPEDSFINKEIPSPEEVESPFDNVTVTDVDNEAQTAKERFLSTVQDLEDEKKTIKDRMFLSTDSACLLFTQTVVQSPMLTPTDENYDFLQALQQNSTSEQSPVKNEEIVPILQDLTSNPDVSDVVSDVSKPDNLELVDAEDISEISAENEVCVQLESSNSEQDISECLKHEDVTDNQQNIKHITLEFIQNEATCDVSTVKSTEEENKSYILTPTIVEHLVEDIDPENDEIIESYDLKSTTEDVETIEDSPVKTIDSQEVITIEDSPEKLPEDAETSNITGNESESDISPTKPVESRPELVETLPELVETLPELVETLPELVETVEHQPELTEQLSELSEQLPETKTLSEFTEQFPEITEQLPAHTEQLPGATEPLPEAEQLPEVAETLESPKTPKSPSSVSEISKIFSPKDQETKEEVKSPVLGETFEDIKKTKEIFERKSTEDTTSVKRDDVASPESDVTECDTNFVCRTSVSTTVTSESTYVETRTEQNSNQDKVLKKKKSKKSKKDNEKENISVCDYTNPNNDDDNLSHVSVKTLCRSFSDLTSIESKNLDNKLKQKVTYGRAKSMTDIRKEETKMDNVFNNVSVKSLRECFDNLTNRTNNNFERTSSTNSDCKPILKTSDRIEKLKSSFSKFDALQKKTVLHVRSSDSGKAQEKFNGNTPADTSSCKSCGKQVFQMEQMKAEKAIWHKNCFRCQECNKQLNVDTYQSNEGVLYCKPHFKALFTPKAVEDEPQPIRPRKHELIIRENQPEELPPDVVRASDKPDLGLEELQNLNVKERFQVFENHENQENSLERTSSTVNVKRSPSILSKLAKFQSKGMDIGVADDSLNGVPVEESSSEEEEEEEEIEGEDAELVRARRAQREKPMHFTNMSDVMSKWESGHQMTKEERREERKQEIQSIRSRLFMGKQAKIKEMYQQACSDSSSGAHVRKQVPLDAELSESARTVRERFERGEQLTSAEQQTLKDLDDAEVFESGISKKSRSIFLELDANASKPPVVGVVASVGKSEVKRAREAFMARQASEDVVRSTDQVDDVEVKTADISSRFKFFETYKEPEKHRKQFRITPPRDGQEVQVPEPQDAAPPAIIEPDTEPATASHTATRMLNVFRQLEESAGKEPVHQGLKPLKRFTPPPEPQRVEDDSEEEYTEEEEEEDEEGDEERRAVDEDLIEAQKAARAKHLRAKFEKWEANELKREQNNSSVNIAEEIADAESQIESAKSLRARFESMRETSSDKERTPRVKVNRFVDTTNNVETCKSCEGRVYPLEKVSCHNNVYHKNCFRCRECNTILRMDSYTYNQGLLYCLPHFKRLFISKGNYEAGFGLDQHKEKWNTVA